MSPSSLHSTHHHLPLPADINTSRSSITSFLILILISVATVPLLFVAIATVTATPAEAAATAIATTTHRSMQRTLFAAPRSVPCSFVPICRLRGIGIDCRGHHHGIFWAERHVACRAPFLLTTTTTTITQNKLQASSDSNKMSTSTINEKFSEANHQFLMEQLAIRLVQGNSNAAAESPPNSVMPLRACIAVAGGGSNAASSIASIPGASSILLESIVTYDRRSFADFVTQNIAQTDSNERWLVDMEQTIPTDPDGELSSSEPSSTSSTSSSQRIKTFQFCSIQAAVLLSRSSLRRSIQLTPSFQDRCLNCIGVGCTSALFGKLSSEAKDGEKKNGRIHRKSKAYVSLSTVKDGTWVWELELDDGRCGNGDITSNNGRRSRPQEEAVVSNVILLAMIQYREMKSLRQRNRITDTDYNTLLGQILDRKGDTISENRFDCPSDASGTDDIGQSAALGASQIIHGKSNVVAVLPIMCDDTSHEKGRNDPLPVIRMETICAENERIFPRDILIVPGSFNPPHHGHIGLANAAVSALRKLRREKLDAMISSDAIVSSPSPKPYPRHSALTSNSSSSLSSSSSSSSILRNLWSAVDKHSDDKYDPAVFFEMSVTNADKPPLDPTEVERRVNIFTQFSGRDMPKDWAVILTNAPLFLQKSHLLAELIPNDGLANDRIMSFVLGTDTMVRIINPKYYGNSRENMLAALVQMKENGVHFIVGGRLEPGTNNFVNGEDEVTSLPPEVQDMFTLMKEDEFRMDISSTELRKRSEQK